MKVRRLHFVLVVFISLLLGYLVGVSKVQVEWQHYKPHVTVVNAEPPPSESTVDFSLFWSVWQKLTESYYDKTAVDPQKLLNGAITGMVTSIGDPYTVFLPPTQNSNFKQGLSGQFEGIGAELGMQGKQIIIMAPLSGTPAEKAGIRAGDAIYAVDGQSTNGWTLQQAVDKIRGPKGTSVTLTVQHKNEDKQKDITIVRATITVKSVDGWVKKVKDIQTVESSKFKNGDDEIAYIKLSQFGDNTNAEWLSLVNNLYQQMKSDPHVKGVILDLRNNPGGYLSDATFVASEFISQGTIVIQDKGNGDQTPFPVTRKGLLLDKNEFPLVVLINKGSASASEIVAGAIQDYKRGILVGETSFGKGTIQEALDLGGGAGLHVTIAKWLTPNGRWIHGKGLTPDVSVSLDEKNPSHDTQLEKAIQEFVQ